MTSTRQPRQLGILRLDTIADPDDPRLADYRNIDEPLLVRERGLFIAEGRLVVARAIASRRFVVRSVLVSPAAARQLASTLSTLPERTPVYVCEPAAFRAITGYNIHRGCLAIIERPPDLSAAALLSSSTLLVVVEAIANPDNMGGIFRNAAAFGADAVLLDPASCDPLYRKAIRTSMAATLGVPFARAVEWPSLLSEARQSGFTVAALTARADAEMLTSFASRTRGSKIALLLGTEGAGLTDAALAHADARVRIDISPAVDSLNVAVAAGIALYALHL